MIKPQRAHHDHEETRPLELSRAERRAIAERRAPGAIVIHEVIRE